MDYQGIYTDYQNAIKMRELSIDNNYELLKEIFTQKILSSISLNTQNFMVPYLAGMKEVFNFVDSEAKKVNFYRDELDKSLSGDKN